MTPSHFYTDPLAAAWMMSHFGFRFVDEQGRRIISIGTAWVFHYHGRDSEPVISDPRISRFYVHPDSLNLLEPQVGDLLDFIHAVDRYRICKDNECDLTKLHRSFARMMVARGDCQIVQRSGIAFHWPERGAA